MYNLLSQGWKKMNFPKECPMAGEEICYQSHHALRRCSKKIKHLRQMMGKRKEWRQGCRKGKMSASWKWDSQTWKEEIESVNFKPMVCTLWPWAIWSWRRKTGHSVRHGCASYMSKVHTEPMPKYIEQCPLVQEELWKMQKSHYEKSLVL